MFQQLRPPVVLYARTSSDKQREAHTVEGQLTALRDACTRQGMAIEAEYIDEGTTGDLPWTERPSANRLLSDARDGRAKTVLVYLYDRFSRDVYEGLSAARQLKLSGASPYSLLEPFDINTPYGEYMFVNSLNNAQLWKAQFLERSREGTARLARDGAWLGGICPFGYRVVGVKREARITPSDELIPGCNLSEAAVIRQMYHWAAIEGRSCFWICDRLTEMGVPPAYTRDGRQKLTNKRKEATSGLWRPARIGNILRNTTYYGIHHYGRRTRSDRGVITRSVPALVDEATWTAAQETMRRNMVMSPKNSKHKYLLRGLIKCGLCGLTYIGTGSDAKSIAGGVTRKTGAWKSYYVCNGKHGARGIYGLKGERCPSKSVDGNIEARVWALIARSIEDPASIMAAVEAQQDKESDKSDDMRLSAESLISQLGAMGAQRDRVVALYRRGAIDESALDVQLSEIKADESRLKADIESLTKMIEATHVIRGRVRAIGEMLAEMKVRINSGNEPDFALKRQIIESLVSSVTVHTTGEGTEREAKVTVNFRFIDPIDVLATCTDIRAVTYLCVPLNLT